MKKKKLTKVVDSFYIFLTAPDEVEKYVEFIEKTTKAKSMMQ